MPLAITHSQNKMTDFSKFHSYSNTNLYTDLFDKMCPDYEYVSALLKIIQPNIIYEMGCGTGRLLPHYIESQASKIIGTDIESEMATGFSNKSEDQRVSAFAHDMTKPIRMYNDKTLIILTSSVLKHLSVESRKTVFSHLHDAMDSEALVYIDHCEYIYGLDQSTDWNCYYDTLRHWWPYSSHNHLKKFFWKKEVEGQSDTLFYRYLNDTPARIITKRYSKDELLADIISCDMAYTEISDSFVGKKNVNGMNRAMGLICKKGSKSNLAKLAKEIQREAITSDNNAIFIALGAPI